MFFRVIDKMDKICKQCEYFDAKGAMPGSNNWGLCSKSKKKNIANNPETPFFRWEDDTCSFFKPLKEFGSLPKQKT